MKFFFLALFALLIFFAGPAASARPLEEFSSSVYSLVYTLNVTISMTNSQFNLVTPVAGTATLPFDTDSIFPSSITNEANQWGEPQNSGSIVFQVKRSVLSSSGNFGGFFTFNLSKDQAAPTMFSFNWLINMQTSCSASIEASSNALVGFSNPETSYNTLTNSCQCSGGMVECSSELVFA